MGNEMGNSNTSELQEEENSTTQVQERSSQETGRGPHGDVAEGKNHIVPVSEGKECHEKLNGLASDVPDGTWSPGLNQTLEGREQEETEIHHPAESAKVEVKSNEAGAEISEIQPTSPSKDSKDHKNLPDYVNDVQENHIVPVTEGKDCHEKENGLASDAAKGAGDPYVLNQIQDEKEQEEIEADPLAESAKVEVNPNNEANDETSGIQPTSPSKDLKDHATLLVSVDDDEGENHTVPLSEAKENHVKEINGFASDVRVGVGAEDVHVVNQISDESEQAGTELHSRAESQPNNESDGETNDIQPIYPSKDSEDLEIPRQSTSEENLSQITDHQLEKQASIEKEDEEEKNATFDTTSSLNDPEPPESVDSIFDQPELAIIHADPPIQDSNKSAQKIEDILRSNLTCTSKENGQPIDADILEDTGKSVVSVPHPKVDIKSDDLTVKEMATEEPVSCEERLEIKDGDEISNDLGEKTTITSEFACGMGINCNGELPTEINQIRSDSPKAEPETISIYKSLNSDLEVSETIDDCIVLAAATASIREESEEGDNKANHYPIQCSEKSVIGSNIDNPNSSASEFVMNESKPDNNDKGTTDLTCGSNKDCIEEAKSVEDGNLVDVRIKDQNKASAETCEDSREEAVMVPESGMVRTESSLTDCKTIEVSEEKTITEETEYTTKASCDVETDTEGSESQNHYVSPKLTVEQIEAFLPTSPLSLVQPQEGQQNCEEEFEKIQSSDESISELKQETFGESFVTKESSVDSANLMVETPVSIAQLATEKPGQDLLQYNPEPTVMVAESNTPANHFSGQCAKVETPAFLADDNQARESMERLSTESNPNTSNIQAQMQKSPSFGLDLRIEARTEESEQTPLLYQDKSAIEDFSSQADVSLGNSIAYTQYGQERLLYQAMPVEEKVVTMERSDSEKSKTPFLGFLKEEEEAHIIVTPQKHDNNTASKKTNKEFLNLSTKEVASTSPKSKEKRKPRSSLFTNCMCCTTVIN